MVSLLALLPLVVIVPSRYHPLEIQREQEEVGGGEGFCNVTRAEGEGLVPRRPVLGRSMARQS